MILPSHRRKIDELFQEWRKKIQEAQGFLPADCTENVIVFLDSQGIINEGKLMVVVNTIPAM